MALIAMAPHVRLLDAAKASALLVDYADRAGVAGVKVRHGRQRETTPGELPAVSLIFVGDDPPTMTIARNMWETTRELEIDIRVDTAVASEDSGLDPTGWDDASRIAAAAMEALNDPASPLRQLCDDITPGKVDPDEKSTGDNVRLVRGITVLYRVRTDDSNVLLAPGEDG